MKLRLLLAPLFAALTLGGLAAPADADDTTLVTGLTVAVKQERGSHDSWRITADWTAVDGVRSYTLAVVDQTSGAGTTTYVTVDTDAPHKEIVTKALAGGETYYVVVHTRAGGDPSAVAEFTTPVLDVTAPTGSYRVNRSSDYLHTDFLEDSATADFQIIQTASAGATSRAVKAGDGTAARPWTSGTVFPLRYTRAGTFRPIVVLTDEFANVREIRLPAVRVLVDAIAPQIRITKPAKPGKVSSWRTVRGTATDAQTGIGMAVALVMQKRGATWWVYDFGKRKWLEGTSSLQKTQMRTKAEPALLVPDATGAWRTPAIKGLRAGRLRVEAAALDNELNIGMARPVSRRVR